MTYVSPHDEDALSKLQQLLAQLNKWRGHIMSALEHANNSHTFDDVVGMVLANRVMFFPYEDCFLIMEKVEYPRFSTFHCFLAGGDMEAVMDKQQVMSDFGRRLGCRYLSIAGREGWLRQLKDRGWQHVSSAMCCLIEDEEA